MTKGIGPAAPPQISRFGGLGKRKRDRACLLRLTAEEMDQLDELAAFHGVSRTSVARMVLKHAHGETIAVPLHAQAEKEVAAAAERLAIKERAEELRKEMRVRSEGGKKRKKKKDADSDGGEKGAK